ncbi:MULTISPECIES: tRNA (N(6)-L-threonylcarbamoyladenosine(37)-C(2))-methylthiotransferase [Methanobacterium]|jgi:MiaB-like tRNA modifying enzyme|uniref:tRNA-t(6)A37 methylthiotransferase n=1 Tax=Methanobacterium veterum TaxID=408577 RepID=A0A9E5DPI5_9EURY|nr:MULTISPECIES: tRNA (N(6)-L-threonylcarbamoyladenosine(37)-C(2))-methylthiotransferase [Methanobacterium]MCZ3366872.1 tRNA (N(6)-L-threonylcarbamoyladenosine(37)-C(2))-methylthiotransferase [Methanobacterium veterum]MCZ3373981.1 tRNA (N(6)-L-threonylcarbamoyladenosine(37)-C(2))-methylthiotransferase [Methanobacterium veterum]
MKVYIDTFGCTFNQGDSQIMAGLLQEDNAQIVSNMEDADVIILNTCYVKQPTEQKVINRIKKIQEQFSDKKLIISGCMVEIDPDKLKKAAPSAGWIGPRQIKSTIDVVKSCMNGKTSRIIGHSDEIKAGLPKIRFDPFVHISQICEGCVGRCTYCCTRFARGKLQSYPVKNIKNEIESAVADGCVEIQLTAQDTAAYGMDTGRKLSELIKEITTIPGDFRLRVGMMHPKSMMRDLNGLIEAFMHKNVYKFMHIPIQSGSDSVLNHMGRDHTVAQYKDIISEVREKIPEVSIATDIIVGYPTETDEDFEDTLKLIEDIKPNFIHISKYRHRPMAISSSMHEIDHKIMKKRSKVLNDLKSKILYQNNLAEIGKVHEILITEKGSKGGYIGRTDSYKHVVIENGEIGTFVKVKINEVTSTYLKGSVL